MSSRRPRAHINHERWLVSYADFITLLFAFFVVLYAFAKADQRKQVQIADSVDSAFRSLGLFSETAQHPSNNAASSSGTDKAVMPMNIIMGEDVLSPARVKSDLDRIHRELAQTLSNQVATHTVSIHMGRDGLVISLREAGFFRTGSATVEDATLPTLRRIATSLGHTPYDLRVEGHTDNVPIHTTDFDSNWELSTARATRMARLFLDMKAIPPDRISAAGYAEFHPVASNATSEGRSENRRVDLVILPRTKVDLSGLPTPAAGGLWRKITDEP